MAALQCEICGGKLMGKPGGIFECDSCGMEYSTAWAKEKIQEIKGTVKVEGTVEVQGTVKVEGPVEVKGGVNIESLLRRGDLALEERLFSRATQFFDEALNYDSGCVDAYLGKLMARLRLRSREEFENCKEDLQGYGDYKKALRFADEERKKVILGYQNGHTYAHAKKMMDTAKNLSDLEEAAKLFKSIIDFKDSEMLASACTEEKTVYSIAQKAMNEAKTEKELLGAAQIFESIIGYRDSAELVKRCSGEAKETKKQTNDKVTRNAKRIAAGYYHVVGLQTNGRVLVTGVNNSNQFDVLAWDGIVSISAGFSYTIGLRSDGTVISAGKFAPNVSKWCDIVAIAAGSEEAIGLRSDGKVEGCWLPGECKITEIAAGKMHNVFLQANKTVIARGNNESHQCNVSDWRNIVAIAAGSWHTVGLCSNGTVVSTGSGRYGELNTKDWKNIVAIAAGDCYTVGLKEDGTVVAVGNNSSGQCNVSGWSDIVAIAAGPGSCYTVGLRSDGRVVVAGGADGSCNVYSWQLYSQEELKEIRRAKRQADIERKRVALNANCTILKKERYELLNEQTKLQAELPTLKGIFSGGRRKQIEARLAQIPTRLVEIDSELARIEEELAALG